MKCRYSKQVYQWPGGVGLVVMTDGQVITADGIRHMDECEYGTLVQVAHSHTRELEFVTVGSLSNYPSQPIPQPTNNGSGY
jgi:hypothetical protein